MLFKGANGVNAKFIGTPIVDPKKKVIWVPKTLVTTFKNPSKFGYLKRIDILL